VDVKRIALAVIVFHLAFPIFGWQGIVREADMNTVRLSGVGVAELKSGAKVLLLKGQHAEAECTVGAVLKTHAICQITRGKAHVGLIASTEAGAWGPFEGLMTWTTAVNLCKSKGMRLPTKDELIEARVGVSRLWEEEPSGEYWSSTDHGDGNGEVVNLENGYGGEISDRGLRVGLARFLAGTRCTRNH